MTSKLVTPTLRPVDKFKPEYCRLDTSSCGRDVSASVLRDERQISSIASKSLRTDSLPGFHIHRDSLLHPCGTNVPPSGQDRQDTVQSQTVVRSKILSGKGILKSRRPAELSGRSNPTPPTSSTSPTLQIETTSGSPGSGNSPSRILVTRSLEILGHRDSSQSESAVTDTPSQTFHVHRRVQFRLGSPCERGWFNHKGNVVSGGVQDVYQHLGTQGSPARCKTPSTPSKEPESVPVFRQLHCSGLHSKTGRYPLSSSLHNDMAGNFSSFAVARTSFSSHDTYRGSTTYWQTPFPDRTN
jgi:hypothetical protein